MGRVGSRQGEPVGQRDTVYPAVVVGYHWADTGHAERCTLEMIATQC
jgi:hypothetical protein